MLFFQYKPMLCFPFGLAGQTQQSCIMTAQCWRVTTSAQHTAYCRTTTRWTSSTTSPRMTGGQRDRYFKQTGNKTERQKDEKSWVTAKGYKTHSHNVYITHSKPTWTSLLLRFKINSWARWSRNQKSWITFKVQQLCTKWSCYVW